MKIHTPPPPPPVEDPSRERPVDRLGTAVWDLIMAYSGVISDDEMRRELEDVLLMYYELNGDGTAGSA